MKFLGLRINGVEGDNDQLETIGEKIAYVVLLFLLFITGELRRQ